MPDSIRKKRQPISCEPCRIRKIRCSRDGQPCSTCVRRDVDCRYVRDPSRHAAGSSASQHISHSFDRTTERLSQRVRRLEQLLLNDGTRSGTSSTGDDTGPPDSGVSGPETEDFSGNLVHDGHGYVRYVPSSLQWKSSRLALADTATSGMSPLPFVSGSVPGESMFSALPSRDQCADLVRIYLESYASLFHVLHDPTFQHQYQSFEECAVNTPLSWMALLYAILGTAVHAVPQDSPLLRISHKQKPLEQIQELSSRYRQLAMRCLEVDGYLWRHNIVTLQALIILIYSINHSHGQSWSLLGLAHHIALSLGCHVDPSHFDLDAVACEERRRCWAALKMLYTQQNTTLGHLGIGHGNFHSDCQPPADVDDNTVRSETSDHEVIRSSDRPTDMTYVLLKFRLYDICTDICDSVLSKQHVNLQSIQRIAKTLEQEQQSCSDRYTGNGRGRASHHAHAHILRTYAHHLTLLLYQPVIMKLSGGRTVHVVQQASERCFAAAEDIIHTHRALCTDETLAPFRWYVRGVGSFQAFHAAVVMLMLFQRGPERDRTLDFVRELRECSNRFQQMAELSPFCAKAAPLLQALIERFNAVDSQADNEDSTICVRSHSSDQTRTDAQLLYTPTSNTSNHERSTNLDMNEGEQQQLEDVLNVPEDLFDLFNEIQPQQWLSPATFPPFDQWLHAIDTTV